MKLVKSGPIEPEIGEYRRCCDCDDIVEEASMGDESWSVCQGCRNIEGKTYTSYEDTDFNRYTEAQYEEWLMANEGRSK